MVRDARRGQGLGSGRDRMVSESLLCQPCRCGLEFKLSVGKSHLSPSCRQISVGGVNLSEDAESIRGGSEQTISQVGWAETGGLSGLYGSGCPLRSGPRIGSNEDVSNVDVISAKVLISSGHTYLDVRTVEEYNRGHIDNAINIPYMFLTDEVAEQNIVIDSVLKGCNSGGRGRKACVDLLNAGYKDLRNLAGGYSAWVDNEFKGDEAAAQQFKTACKFRP
ncbi:Rhodanese-like domain-containing protein 19, mitochondrial [Capsicum annuum]|nr:Rhodanese-like domain-containing protein 19, mitochondrial [Capsicum annuum]KAF3684874.1 Rhodanese-like domain-containing protein 19, mitochondrial [Capsicum annuum]